MLLQMALFYFFIDVDHKYRYTRRIFCIHSTVGGHLGC